jgi:preprotein translocase subunit SecE
VYALFLQLFQVSLYKRTQGRVTRQVTFAAIALALAAGLYRLSQSLEAWGCAREVYYAVPAFVLLVGVWWTFRLVNAPKFADFLIAVEAEMNKVSWPTRSELIRGSAVVLVTILALAVILLVFDTFWAACFKALGVIPEAPAPE